MPEYYEITISGHLDQCWSERFAGLKLTHLEENKTLLAGSLPDQAALHGLLELIRDLNLKLISVTSGGPSTQQIIKEVDLMKTVVVSYSLTGNNRDLASSLAATLGVDHVEITEPGTRSMGTIVLDTVFKRKPRILMPEAKIKEHEMVLFVGPVWMGQIASPFRACLKQLGQDTQYGFISICGGADGPNPKLADELKKRVGRAPICLIELHIADILPAEPKPTRDDTMAYRLTASDVRNLTDTIAATLRKTTGN